MKSNILIIDDDELVLLSVKELLAIRNYNITMVKNGSQGLELARKTKFDLIILDIVMPGISGYDACRMFRNMQEYRSVPIIMFSAKNNKMDKKKGFESGANIFLPKPIDPLKLLDVVHEICSLS